jgi:hypothetical protein
MSVEAAIIAAIVEEGASGLRKMYQAGVTAEDFPVYEEEIAWIEQRAQERKSINPRVFRRMFEDFEWTPPTERLQELLPDLKNERCLTDINALIQSTLDGLTVENATEHAQHMRDRLADITRLHVPHSDHTLIGGAAERVKRMRQLRALRRQGIPPGIPTGLKHIDVHWDGLVNGRLIVVLGRPGECKSYLLVKFGWEAVKGKYRVAMFSPEMSREEHEARLHTLASADKDVQAALGLERSFRNRALMNGVGFSLKKYGRFVDYLEREFSEFILLTNTGRRGKMSVSYIDSRIEDLQPDLVIVDPIYKLKRLRTRQTETAEIGEIADSLQDLAETYNIPVIVTNQAHRQGAHRGEAPGKDSSYNSDVPVQEGDHVIGVKHISEERIMKMRCSKSRFGQEFHFECNFNPNTGIMRELTEPRGDYYNGTEDVEDEELREMVEGATKRKKVTA